MTMALLKIGDFVEPVEVAHTSSPVPKLWYLLRIHPNRELTVEEKLNERGVCAYIPKEKRSVRAGRSRQLRVAPIFPGLLFIPDFEADLRRLKDLAEGIVGYVMFGERAAYASPRIMESIRGLEAVIDIPVSKRARKYAIGQLVRVVDGPFNWWEGRIERLDTHGRLRVLLNILEREVPVEMDEDQIEPV
jgi:transcriptional antiterminator NusG